jgi:sugar phosphate isomerase/epimerase
VALEFLPMMPIDTIAKTLSIVHRVDGPVGVCVDTWHFFRGPDTWVELEALPPADLAYVQFNDALPLAGDDLMSETLQRRTLPGEGEFELARFCEIIRAKGYDGPVAVEIMSSELRAEGPHEYARKCEAGARTYWP